MLGCPLLVGAGEGHVASESLEEAGNINATNCTSVGNRPYSCQDYGPIFLDVTQINRYHMPQIY